MDNREFIPLDELLASLPPEQRVVPDEVDQRIERMLDEIDPHRLDQGNDLGTTRALRALVRRQMEEIDRLKRGWADINRLEQQAEEAECVSMCLDHRDVPTESKFGVPLSLWGRVVAWSGKEGK